MRFIRQPNGQVKALTTFTLYDRFNRVADHSWKKGATNVVRIEHIYDQAGNRTTRRVWVSPANMESYKYDQVNQIKSFTRALQLHVEMFDNDHTGNWTQYRRIGLTENRTHNAANEIQAIANHNRNGNMTVMPGLKGKYDAWNRLVETKDSSDVLLAKYEYNGLNHRVKKTVDDVVTMSFYNRQWQELDSATVLPSGEGELMSYIWGTRYIDDLVLRERGDEKLYSLADPNWNVVATTNDAGVVQERMKYDAFGKVTWMTAAFATKAASDLAWNRTFTGQVLDSESGLMLYRNRYYHTGLGRFVSRDPIGYDAEDVNIYRYVGNMPIVNVDPLGLQLFTGPNVPSASVQQQCSFLLTAGGIAGTYAFRTARGLVWPTGNRPGGTRPTFPIPSAIFDHPDVANTMNTQLENIENRICKGSGNSDFSGSNCRGNTLAGDCIGVELLYPGNFINRCIGLGIINNYTLEHDVKVTKGPYGEKKCYDVDITWKFKDHTQPLNEGGLLPERFLRWCQQHTNANFNISAKKR